MKRHVRTSTFAAVMMTVLAATTAGAGQAQKPDDVPKTDAAARAPGEQPPASTPARERPASAGLTVAVLDFAADTPGAPDLGAQIGEILTASLSGIDGVTLVDRSSLARVLLEQELNLSGVVSPDQASKVGKLVGARLLVTGKAFVVGKKTYLTAKVIGTETSLVDPVLVTADQDADLGKLAVELADKLAVRLREAGPRLVGDDGEIPPDPLPALRERLAGRPLPVVTVSIDERHVTATVGRAIDPAVQTELRLMLTECGFQVIDGDDADRGAAGVTLEIGGEAMSEFAARIGNLVSCSARAEITVKNRKTREVLFTHRRTARAVDLSEQIAGKTALQRAGRIVGIRLLEHFIRTLPAAEAPDLEPSKPE